MRAWNDFFCMMSLCILAASPLIAADKVILHDARTGADAVTCPLPPGWKGSGSVVLDEGAASPINQRVRTMQLVKGKDNVIANYISAWEVPSKKRALEARELADILLPAASLLPGYKILSLQDSVLSLAPREVQELRMGRDRLRQSLGEHVTGHVQLLTANFLALKQGKDGDAIHNVIVGAVVHERSIRTGFRTITTVAFHDIVILGGPVQADAADLRKPASSPELEKAMGELAGAARRVSFDKQWLQEYIRDTAHSFDGMPKLDEAALPALAKKAEAGLKSGFSAVIATMQASFSPNIGIY